MHHAEVYLFVHSHQKDIDNKYTNGEIGIKPNFGN
jgi:hypothetical protein